MIAALAWLAGSSWGRVAALGFLFAAAFGLFLWRIFFAEKSAARTETLEKTIHALTTRIATDESLRALNPAARRERLREWARNP